MGHTPIGRISLKGPEGFGEEMYGGDVLLTQ